MWWIFLNWKNDVMIILAVAFLGSFLWGFIEYSRIEPLKAEINVKDVQIQKLNEDKVALQSQIDQAQRTIMEIKANDKRLAEIARRSQEELEKINLVRIIPPKEVENEIKPATNQQIVQVFNDTINGFLSRVYSGDKTMPAKQN